MLNEISVPVRPHIMHPAPVIACMTMAWKCVAGLLQWLAATVSVQCVMLFARTD